MNPAIRDLRDDVVLADDGFRASCHAAPLRASRSEPQTLAPVDDVAPRMGMDATTNRVCAVTRSVEVVMTDGQASAVRAAIFVGGIPRGVAVNAALNTTCVALAGGRVAAIK